MISSLLVKVLLVIVTVLPLMKMPPPTAPVVGESAVGDGQRVVDAVDAPTLKWKRLVPCEGAVGDGYSAGDTLYATSEGTAVVSEDAVVDGQSATEGSDAAVIVVDDSAVSDRHRAARYRCRRQQTLCCYEGTFCDTDCARIVNAAAPPVEKFGVVVSQRTVGERQGAAVEDAAAVFGGREGEREMESEEPALQGQPVEREATSGCHM